MTEYEKLQGIAKEHDWNTVILVDKGWSSDKKYFIQDKHGDKLLLRVCDIENLDKKRREYENLCKISKLGINMSMPVEFGVCKENGFVYSLLTWIDGEDAEIKLPTLSEEEQYSIGKEAGEILKTIHSIPAPQSQEQWSTRFNRKIDTKLKSYFNCGIKMPCEDKVVQYIQDNRYLLEGRQQTIQHGDFHVGNLIVTEDNRIGVIDFNRYDFGDPWDEFNRMIFSAHASTSFAAGQIDGYFNNNVPDKFFKLMALYMAANALSSVYWAVPFGKKEIDVMLRNINEMLDYYDNFSTYVPKWYK